MPASAPVAARDRAPKLGAGAVGIARQQQDMLAPIDIRAVDAGIGEHEAEFMGDDQRARTMAQHLGRFCKDQLDHARVLAGLLGEDDRAGRWRNSGEIDQSAFRLGDDLLCQHKNVAGGQRKIGVAQGLDDDRGEIVAGRDHGNAGQRGEDKALRVSGCHVCDNPTAVGLPGNQSRVIHHPSFRAPRSGEPGIRRLRPTCRILDSGFALARAPE